MDKANKKKFYDLKIKEKFEKLNELVINLEKKVNWKVKIIEDIKILLNNPNIKNNHLNELFDILTDLIDKIKKNQLDKNLSWYSDKLNSIINKIKIEEEIDRKNEEKEIDSLLNNF